MTGAQRAWLSEVDKALRALGSSVPEVDFPFEAWFDRAPAAWMAEKALALIRHNERKAA